jgi:drug/metabolite transporter (DMT)-like permease
LHRLGGQQVAIKLTAADISPVMQSGIRSVGATILVGFWIVLRGRPLIERDGTLWWGVAAGLPFAFEFLLIYLGLEFTHASRAVIFFIFPHLLLLLVHKFLFQENDWELFSSWVLALHFLESWSLLENQKKSYITSLVGQHPQQR